jgi:hypothetical protein
MRTRERSLHYGHRCPRCGSRARRVFVLASETITFREGLDLKQKRPGDKRPAVEIRQGDSYSTSRQKWVEHSRRIDRTNDWYEETVRDPESGEVLHEDHEHLKNHRGHGSAKSPES